MILDKTKNTLQGTFWGILNKMVSLVFPFVIRTIIIRKLGAEYSGLSSLFTSILQVLSLAELGFGSAIVFTMYKSVVEEDKKTLSMLLNFYRKVYIYIGCLVFIIGLIFLPFINYFIHGNLPKDINVYILYLIYLLNTVISYFFFAYRACLLSAYQREAINSIIQMITNLIMFSIQIAVLLISKNYYFYIAFLPLFTCLYNLIRFIYVRKQYPDITCKGTIDKDQKKDILIKISALFLHKIGGITVNTIDNIVISIFLGLIALSNYNNYYYLIAAVTSIVLIFFNALTAGLGNSILISSIKKIRQDFYLVFYINGFIVSVCTVCFFSLFQDFITLWVGELYLFDTITMVLFCAYFYVHAIRRTIISYRDAAGMWIDNKWQPIVSAVLNLVLNITLIHYIGVKGIILSTIVAMILIDIPWETVTLIKNLLNESTKKYIFQLFYYTFITFIACIAEHFLLKQFSIQNVHLRLFVEGITSIILSCTFFLMATIKSEECLRLKIKIRLELKTKLQAR